MEEVSNKDTKRVYENNMHTMRWCLDDMMAEGEILIDGTKPQTLQELMQVIKNFFNRRRVLFGEFGNSLREIMKEDAKPNDLNKSRDDIINRIRMDYQVKNPDTAMLVNAIISSFPTIGPNDVSIDLGKSFETTMRRKKNEDNPRDLVLTDYTFTNPNKYIGGKRKKDNKVSLNITIRIGNKFWPFGDLISILRSFVIYVRDYVSQYLLSIGLPKDEWRFDKKSHRRLLIRNENVADIIVKICKKMGLYGYQIRYYQQKKNVYIIISYSSRKDPIVEKVFREDYGMETTIINGNDIKTISCETTYDECLVYDIWQMKLFHVFEEEGKR